MRTMKSQSAALRFAYKHAGRRPFSFIFNDGSQFTAYYYGGWNILPAAYCLDYPSATINLK